MYFSLANNEIRLLYITPEYAVNQISQLLEISRTSQICCFAVDEAHCVSQWGHDFRDEYRKLSKLRDLDRSIPYLAMTATATPSVRNDICENLRLKNPVVTVTSFDRLGLEMFFRSLSNE